MADMNMQWSHFLNCAGSMVVVFAFLLFALCMLASIFACFAQERRPARLILHQEFAPETHSAADLFIMPIVY